MVVGLVLLLATLAIRTGAPADRTAIVVLTVLAYLAVIAGAYVGGDVVYALGNMVDRHAWRGRGTKWVPLDLGDVTTIPEGVPTRAKAGPNSLVLVRVGSTTHALHDTCAHAGGPLSEGRIVDGCIECPLHQGRFDLATGAPKAPPVTEPVRVYPVKTENGKVYVDLGE